MTDISDFSYGSAGVPYHGLKYYLEDWPEGGYSANDKPNPRGEIVVGKIFFNIKFAKFTIYFFRWRYNHKRILQSELKMF